MLLFCWGFFFHVHVAQKVSILSIVLVLLKVKQAMQDKVMSEILCHSDFKLSSVDATKSTAGSESDAVNK